MRKKKSLALDRETLRALTGLDRVVGGAGQQTFAPGCTVIGCRSDIPCPPGSKQCTADTAC